MVLIEQNNHIVRCLETNNVEKTESRQTSMEAIIIVQAVDYKTNLWQRQK